MLAVQQRQGSDMDVTGSCHCGKLRFEATIDPERVAICHCEDCQTLSGSAFRISVRCPEDQFRMLAGTPSIYVKTAASGNRRQQAFCGTCGSAIYATDDMPRGPRVIGLRVGALAQRQQLIPRRQFWCQSALPWLPELPGVQTDSQ